MKYIVATEDKLYLRWQIAVQINNFKKFGIDKDLVYVISFKGKPSKEILALQAITNVEMFFIQDERVNSVYIPSIRPHILAKFFFKYPQYGKAFFYVDPDVLFLKKPKFGSLLKGKINYLSDTHAYICAAYIRSKSPQLLSEMAEIVGIGEEVIDANDREAGGAQYLLKNIEYTFWQKVEKDSENLYRHMVNTSNKYNSSAPIQYWTADMWAVLWNLWLLGKETKIDKSLNFAWATDGYNYLNEVTIFHNAGITSETDCFNKGQYTNKSPFFMDFTNMNKNKASYRYVEEIMDAQEKYGKLI